MYESEIPVRKDISINPDELSELFESESLLRKNSHQTLARLGTKGLLEKLNVDPKVGIVPDGNELTERQNLFGKHEESNKNPAASPVFSNLKRVFGELHFIMPLFFSFFIFSFSFLTKAEDELIVLALMMFFSVSIIGIVATIVESQKQTEFEKSVASSKKNKFWLLRTNSQKLVKSTDVVVGDILLIMPGLRIPFDCVLVEGRGIEADESRLNGARNTKQKSVIEENDGDPFILSDSVIITGKGKAVICAVGEHSRIGLLSKIKAQSQEIPANVSNEISDLSKYLMKIGLVLGTLTMFNLTCKNIANPYQSFPRFFYHFGKDLLTSCLIFCMSVPESLSIVLFLSQIVSNKFATTRKLLTKSLSTFVGLGAIDSICFDKTGTLTNDSFDVSVVYLNDKLNNQIKRKQENKEILELLADAIATSSSMPVIGRARRAEADSEESENDLAERSNRLNQSGATKLDLSLLRFRKEFNSKNREELLETIVKQDVGFSPSGEKYQIIAHRLEPTRIRVFCRGPPNFVINSCSEQLIQNGKKQSLDVSKKKKIIDNMSKILTNQGLAGVAFAYAEFEIPAERENGLGEVLKVEEVLKNPKDFILIGALGLKEQLKEEASHVIYKLKEAGIKVRLVSGDISVNAIKCAVNCGILEDESYADIEGKYADSSVIDKSFVDFNYNKRMSKQDVSDLSMLQKGKKNVMLGRELREKAGEAFFNPRTRRYEIQNIQNFAKAVDNLTVLAQASSEDKKLLMDGLVQLNKTVGFVGDGNNDVAAIKRADVGVSMGMSSTELARSSSDAIILDDRLENLLIGIEWGRNALENLYRLVYFQVTIMIVFSVMVSVNEIALPQTPLSLGHVIWLLVLAKLLPGLMISSEQPSPALMKPNTKDAASSNSVFPLRLWGLILGQAVYYFLILSFILADIPMPNPSKSFQEFGLNQAIWIKQLRSHYTILFNCIGFLIIFTLLNARRINHEEQNLFQGLFRNPRFVLMWFSTIVLHLIFVNAGGVHMKTEALSFRQNLSCLSVGLGSSVVHVIIKGLINQILKSNSKGEKDGFNSLKFEEEEKKPLNIEEKEPSKPISAGD